MRKLGTLKTFKNSMWNSIFKSQQFYIILFFKFISYMHVQFAFSFLVIFLFNDVILNLLYFNFYLVIQKLYLLGVTLVC